MRFSLLLVVALCAFAAAEDAAEEGIFKLNPHIGDRLKKHLKDLAREVGKTVLDKAKDILTDGLKLQPTKDVEDAIKADPSTEGIFDTTATFVLKKANELALEHESEGGPSHEGIVANFGAIHKISEAELLFNIRYNKTHNVDVPSHEGIFDIITKLGGLAIKGLGGLIGGKVGGAITSAGDFIGNLFYSAPAAASQEGIVEEVSHEGIFDGAARLLHKGAGKLAGGLLRAAFDSANGYLGNCFLARGAFNGYRSIHAPANEIIDEAKNRIKSHSHPEVQECIDGAEHNFTQLFNEYSKNGQACIVDGQKSSKKILSKVEDIVFDSVKRVEDAHRETGNCFDKDGEEDRILCLDSEVPEQIKEHSKKILHYGEELANYVQKFSDINTNFDVCLVGHLGAVRREVYNIVNYFHYCVENNEGVRINL